MKPESEEMLELCQYSRRIEKCYRYYATIQDIIDRADHASPNYWTAPTSCDVANCHQILYMRKLGQGELCKHQVAIRSNHARQETVG